MGRPERPLDPESGPQQLFASQLRQLREHAGRPTYRAMTAVVNYSAPALSRAAAGERFPPLDATLAFVRACGGDGADMAAALAARTLRVDSGAAGADDRAGRGPARRDYG